MGFIDLQVNGYGGVDYNRDDLTAESLHRSCTLMRQHGVEAFLPTIITDEVERMCARVQRIVRLRSADPLALEMIPGLHIEGPFLNPQRGYIGAHPAHCARSADVAAADQLLDAGEGLIRIFTLAPECDENFSTVKWLSDRDVVVSAGHTDASLATLRGAIDAGLSMFTHCGNGCPPELPRHDNIIQRALSLSDQLHIGFIADGVHIPLFTLKNFLSAIGFERCFIVTDAISAAGLGAGMFSLGNQSVKVGEDLAARSPDGSHLMGSAVTLQRSTTLLAEIGIGRQEIRLLTETNPRQALSLNTAEIPG
jgi:N-acetylglucosamine-6-phosphate deacetylase